jgi:hypothetical protein
MRQCTPPTVLAVALALATSATRAAPPEICRIQGGNTKTIWGTGFQAGQTEVYVWDAPFDEDAVLAALRATPYRARDLLPAEPPKGARKLSILDADSRGLVMAVEFTTHYTASGFYDARAGGQVCWVKNADGVSHPWLVRSARPCWVYPETAHPGDRIRIFGRDLDAKLVARKSQADGQVQALAATGPGRHPLYERWASVPEDLAPGVYDIHVHNGAGGLAGWGGPVKLTVEPTPEPVRNVVNAQDAAARGNGIDDDTEALRKALIQAGEAGGGIVYLPPGRYAISATLWVPSGVTLQGAGPGSSVLTVLDSNPMRFDVPTEIAAAMPGHFRARMQEGNRGAMLWMRDNSAVTDMAFVDGPRVLHAIFGSYTGCRIERCTMRMTHAPMAAVMVEWGSHGFVLRDCDIAAAAGGLFMVHGPHTQAYIGGNTIRCLHPGTANNLFVRSFIHSIIENNTVRDGDRNWVSQLSHASCYHSILQGNLFTNNIPRRHNAGENMYESKSATWHGPVSRADANTVTLERASFEDGSLKGMFAVVLDGPGLGQYRQVLSNTGNTLAVEPPWDVLPDSSTHVMVGYAYVETLWIDNTEEHTANWTGFWGNNFGHVIDGHVLRDGSGLYLWAHNRDVPSPVAFCDIIGSRVIGRGTITLRGPLVFGNTIRFSEVVDFRYRPSFHIQPTWLADMDPNQRAGIALEAASHQMDTLPQTAPLKHWNIIEGTHVYDGPRGIYVAPEAKHTILKSNAIHVDGEAVTDESGTAIVK